MFVDTDVIVRLIIKQEYLIIHDEYFYLRSDAFYTIYNLYWNSDGKYEQHQPNALHSHIMYTSMHSTYVMIVQ